MRRTRYWRRSAAPPHADLAPPAPPRSGMTDAVAVDKVPVTLQYAPFTRAGQRLLLVAEYELSRLRYALDALGPATAWLVNGHAQVIASTAGFIAFETLTKGNLADAAKSTGDKAEVMLSRDGVDVGAIVAHVPVRDSDKTPVVPGWRLVTGRSVNRQPPLATITATIAVTGLTYGVLAAGLLTHVAG